MIYQLVNKKAEILPLVTSNITLNATSLIMFALSISIARFKSINFIEIGL